MEAEADMSQPIRHDFLRARAHCDVFQAGFHGKGWRNYTKAAVFVITETQFAIKSLVT